MRNRSVFSLFTLILVIFGLFAACADTSSSDSDDSGIPIPNPKIYTVSFETNGGSPAPKQQSVADGLTFVLPPAMTKTDYIFGGWYKEAACNSQWDFAYDTVTDNIKLYAQWYTPILVPGTTLAEKLQWLKSNATSNSGYILEVTADENLAPQNISYNNKFYITVQLQGSGNPKVITLSDNGSLFSIGNFITLILDKNLTLVGKNNNNASLVTVYGNLIMNQGVKITGNVYNYPNFNSMGGGVYVHHKGTFIMSGGEISDNSNFVSYGGGVVVSGCFTMSGGKISNNTVSGNNRCGGGGVLVEGHFTMSGGEISGNTVITSSTSSVTPLSGGGGVCVNGRTLSIFDKTGGTIYGYTAESSKSNVVKNNFGIVNKHGHAVYAYSTGIYANVNDGIDYIKRKETTAEPGNNLSYSWGTWGGDHRWWGLPVWSGAWDN